MNKKKELAIFLSVIIIVSIFVFFPKQNTEKDENTINSVTEVSQESEVKEEKEKENEILPSDFEIEGTVGASGGLVVTEKTPKNFSIDDFNYYLVGVWMCPKVKYPQFEGFTDFTMDSYIFYDTGDYCFEHWFDPYSPTEMTYGTWETTQEKDGIYLHLYYEDKEGNKVERSGKTEISPDTNIEYRELISPTLFGENLLVEEAAFTGTLCSDILRRDGPDWK